MRFSTAVLAPVLSIGLIAPALAQELDQQTRQQIEAVHTKWVDAVNNGDANTLQTIVGPNAITIDVFGRTIGPPTLEFIQTLHKKGVTLSFPIDGIQPIKGDQAAVAYGTFTSKFTDPNIPPGQGNWIQVFERDGDSWKIRVYASSRSTLAAQVR